MLLSLWNTIFYEPLYNALVFLISIIPGGDLGIAVILLTLLVKFILYPLSKKSIISQVKLRALEPKINKLKEEYKDKAEQAKKLMALYKENKTNPFSGCLVVLIQFPIIIALYYVFQKGITPDHALYSFIHFPAQIGEKFLGIFSLGPKGIVLAILAGVSQYFQTRISMPTSKNLSTDDSMQAQFSKSMNTQMKYFLPLMIMFISYQVSSVIALYFITSSIFAIAQELLIRKKMAKLNNGGLITNSKENILIKEAEIIK